MSLMNPPRPDYLTYLVGDLSIPCEYSENPWCPNAEAKWVLLVLCPACGFGGRRLADTHCKDLFINTDDIVECINCGELRPPREFLKDVEAL